MFWRIRSQCRTLPGSHQTRPPHRIPAGRNNHLQAGPGGGARLLWAQQFLQGHLPRPRPRQLDHRLPGVRQAIHH
ncbi:hypothetical protein B1218_32795, partial [Pseudomonas ogarae]